MERFHDQAIDVGTVCGVRIRVHLVFLALVVVLLLQTLDSLGVGGALWFAVNLLALCASLLVHELGHALTARRLGLRVYDIVFSPFGGMARLQQLPDNPRVELAIAAAGPVANLTLVALLLSLRVIITPDAPLFPRGSLVTWTVFEIALMVNVLMGTVNLIPAFPMDGGRIFRAILARRLDYVEATRRAVYVGRGVALTAAGIALVHRAWFALALVALFVWIVGERELRAALQRRADERAGQAEPDAASPTPSARRFLLFGDDRADPAGLMAELTRSLRDHVERGESRQG